MCGLTIKIRLKEWPNKKNPCNLISFLSTVLMKSIFAVVRNLPTDQTGNIMFRTTAEAEGDCLDPILHKKLCQKPLITVH